jgi:carboxypeptidase C (cathepsin A)
MRVLTALLLLVGVLADIPTDLVTTLPGLPYEPVFKIYSGYLTVNATTGRALHYVFMESQSNPINDPVVLWLNGGPGCSSMGGLFYENGPFVFPEGETTLMANNYSWNLNTSMLYFESPAGVGFSPVGNQTFNPNDNLTAIDGLAALVQFFTAYPEFSSQEFFISGESYGGIYVPTLAYQVLLWNNQTSQSLPINLQGILVGNGVTDFYQDNTVLPYFAWWHSLINDTVWSNWTTNACHWQLGYPEPASNDVCSDIYMQVLNAFDNIYIYDIYRNCVFNNTSTKHRYNSWSNLKEAVPCVDEKGLYAYLNNATVKQAMHVADFNGTWDICADLNYTIDYQRGSIWVYPYLFQAGVRVLIYSGDTDASVPTIGSQTWINSLNLTESNPWRAWYLNGQVAGFTQDYTVGLKFLTIRGTGHMSIQWKRPEGAHMYWSFISNQPL